VSREDIIKNLVRAPSTLAKNTAWTLLGRVLRVVAQAIYFFSLARSLGVAEYGAFVGAIATVSIIAPFSSLGSGNLLIKHVSQDRSAFCRSWGEALIITVLSGVFLSLVGTIISSLFLPVTISWKLVLLLAVADLIFARIAEVAAQAFQAIEDVRTASALMLGFGVCRMLAALALMIILHRASALTWALLYLLSSVVPCFGAILVVNLKIGMPSYAFSVRSGELLQGFYFAISLSAQTIYNDVDKIMLVRMAGLRPAGIYGAAYRLVDVACAPLGALLYAAYPRFFLLGKQGIHACLQFARRLVARSAIWGIVASTGLFVCAPLLLPILGRQYADSVAALRWLAPIVLLRCVHYLAADTLTGCGYQGLRSSIQVLVAIVNVSLNMVILPRYSWRGAAWTSLISDGILLLALWSSVLILARISKGGESTIRPGSQPSVLSLQTTFPDEAKLSSPQLECNNAD